MKIKDYNFWRARDIRLEMQMLSARLTNLSVELGNLLVEPEPAKPFNRATASFVNGFTNASDLTPEELEKAVKEDAVLTCGGRPVWVFNDWLDFERES